MNVLRDKVLEIIYVFNLLSSENQSTLLKCADNTLEAEISAKNSVPCTRLEEQISDEFHGDTGKVMQGE